MQRRGEKKKSSQPTYEELKPRICEKRAAGTERSQPTYEELKLDQVTEAEYTPYSSQPTYEELKQHPGGVGGAKIYWFPAYL